MYLEIKYINAGVHKNSRNVMIRQKLEENVENFIMKMLIY